MHRADIFAIAQLSCFVRHRVHLDDIVSHARACGREATSTYLYWSHTVLTCVSLPACTPSEWRALVVRRASLERVRVSRDRSALTCSTYRDSSLLACRDDVKVTQTHTPPSTCFIPIASSIAHRKPFAIPFHTTHSLSHNSCAKHVH